MEGTSADCVRGQVRPPGPAGRARVRCAHPHVADDRHARTARLRDSEPEGLEEAEV